MHYRNIAVYFVCLVLFLASRFACAAGTIHEDFSFHPDQLSSSFQQFTPVMPSQRTTTGFGIFYHQDVRMACGPSPENNTFICVDLLSKSVVGKYPIPGGLAVPPVYFDNSWLLATTKGILLRIDADNQGRPTKISGETLSLWGSKARELIAALRPKTFYVDSPSESAAASAQEMRGKIYPGMRWAFPSASQFVGKPIVYKNRIYALTANQYFQAFDVNTGKLLWALRLSPDTNLTLMGASVQVTEREILVGTSSGALLGVSHDKGTVLWSVQIPEATAKQRVDAQLPAGPDKFPALVVPPLLTNDGIIVSNAESLTQKIMPFSHHVRWSYPAGSAATPVSVGENIVLGTPTGHVVSLKADNGSVVWKVAVSFHAPIVSLFLASPETLLAASRSGEVFALDPASGRIKGNTMSVGQVSEGFFPGVDNSQGCLSFSTHSLRCYRF